MDHVMQDPMEVSQIVRGVQKVFVNFGFGSVFEISTVFI